MSARDKYIAMCLRGSGKVVGLWVINGIDDGKQLNLGHSFGNVPIHKETCADKYSVFNAIRVKVDFSKIKCPINLLSLPAKNIIANNGPGFLL